MAVLAGIEQTVDVEVGRSLVPGLQDGLGVVQADPPDVLRELAVGSIVLRDVQAYVSRPGRLPEPLLGMSFLDRLGGFEKSGRRLILRQ